MVTGERRRRALASQRGGPAARRGGRLPLGRVEVRPARFRAAGRDDRGLWEVQGMRSEDRRAGSTVSRCRRVAAAAVVAALGWGPGFAAAGLDAGLTPEQLSDFESLSAQGTDPTAA